MVQEQEKLQFLPCSQCDGSGYIADKKCQTCHGKGIIAYLDGHILYWTKKITRRYLYLYKLETVIYIVNLVILLFLFVLGLASLIYSVYLVDFEGAWQLSFWLDGGNIYHLIFWLSMIADLYLIYYLSIQKESKQKVLTKKYESEETKETLAPPPINWQQVKDFPNKKMVDVSKSLTPDAHKLINKAFEMASKYKAAEVGPVHFFIAAFIVSSKVNDIFLRLGVDLRQLANQLGKVAAHYPQRESETVFSNQSVQLIFKAYRFAYDNKLEQVGVPEIIHEAIRADQLIQEAFIDLDLTLEKVDNVISWLRIRKLLSQQWQRYRASSRLKSKTGIDRAMTAVQTQYLNQFSEDLTLLAKRGYLPLCVDREKEFNEIFRVLEGSSVKGTILVGEPGVGKTAIVEGLAQRMIADDVPDFLKDKRLVSLSIAQLVAGASATEAQERLLISLNEIIQAGNVVLFIDNIHDLVGIAAGSAESLDMSEVIVEGLSKNLFILIATTNPYNYVKTIERTSLGSVAKKITINEPEINEAIQIIEGKIAGIEGKNNVYFSYEAIDKAVRLTDRFVHDYYLPYKTISLLEESAVWARNNKGKDSLVTGNDVANLLSEKINMPVSELTETESDKLLNLETLIHQRMVNQNEAVTAVADSLRRARAELRDIERPIANLLFLGPTGVGKTELAKTIAEVYFGNEENMIRLDMSEYQEKQSINRLIGSPPGYEGSGQGGQLTEAVRLKPFSIVLLDELEKAHPDILNVFLQVMEDGRLTDATGRTIDFTNTILIATSNAGSSYIQEQVNQGTSIEQIKATLLQAELKQYFRPEFLNRFDNIIVFKPLSLEHVIEIAHLMLNQVAENLAAKGIHFQVTDKAVKELAQQGFDPQFGARPLRRVIQDQVDNALAQHLLKGQIKRSDLVILEPGGNIRIEKYKKKI